MRSSSSRSCTCPRTGSRRAGRARCSGSRASATCARSSPRPRSAGRRPGARAPSSPGTTSARCASGSPTSSAPGRASATSPSTTATPAAASRSSAPPGSAPTATASSRSTSVSRASTRTRSRRRSPASPATTSARTPSTSPCAGRSGWPRRCEIPAGPVEATRLLADLEHWQAELRAVDAAARTLPPHTVARLCHHHAALWQLLGQWLHAQDGELDAAETAFRSVVERDGVYDARSRRRAASQNGRVPAARSVRGAG